MIDICSLDKIGEQIPLFSFSIHCKSEVVNAMETICQENGIQATDMGKNTLFQILCST